MSIRSDLPSSINTSYTGTPPNNDGESKGNEMKSVKSRTNSLSINGISKNITYSPGKSISGAIKDAFSGLKSFFNKLVGRQGSSRPHADSLQSDLLQKNLLNKTAPEEQPKLPEEAKLPTQEQPKSPEEAKSHDLEQPKLPAPDGNDDLSLEMKQNGILHVSEDGSQRYITNDDLPPPLDLSKLK